MGEASPLSPTLTDKDSKVIFISGEKMKEHREYFKIEKENIKKYQKIMTELKNALE